MIKVNLQGLTTIDNKLQVFAQRAVGFLDPTTTSIRDISSLGVDTIHRPTSAITMEVVGAAADTASGAGAQLVEINVV